MKNKITCCYQCQERNENCHSNCDEYLLQAKLMREERQNAQKQKQKMIDIGRATRDAIQRMSR